MMQPDRTAAMIKIKPPAALAGLFALARQTPGTVRSRAVRPSLPAN